MNYEYRAVIASVQLEMSVINIYTYFAKYRNYKRDRTVVQGRKGWGVFPP